MDRGEIVKKRRRKQRSYTREQYLEAMKLLQNGLSLYKTAKTLNIPVATLYYWWRKGVKPPAAWWEPRPSKELAYVLGVLEGDGWVHEKRRAYLILLKVKDYEFAHEFSKCLATVLNKPMKEPRYYRGYWLVEYSSKAFYYWYKTLRANLNNFRNYVEHNKETVSAFLRGIFDSDGGQHYNKTYDIYSIRLYNTDLALLRYVQYLLSRYFSIPSHLYLGGQACNNRKPRYKIEIYRRPLVERFLEMVGFTITRKQFGLAVRRK